ncbi:MAG: hypothetical protein EXR83_03695 [Gammaproteobacteria bacterium]|nr:hypothetical protein [Gammaproteobacteria bacterium]
MAGKSTICAAFTPTWRRCAGALTKHPGRGPLPGLLLAKTDAGALPKAGSYRTGNDLGQPILATRDPHGKFHALVNACRHRGAGLTAEPRGEQSRYTTPHHRRERDPSLRHRPPRAQGARRSGQDGTLGQHGGA